MTVRMIPVRISTSIVTSGLYNEDWFKEYILERVRSYFADHGEIEPIVLLIGEINPHTMKEDGEKYLSTIPVSMADDEEKHYLNLALREIAAKLKVCALSFIAESWMVSRTGAIDRDVAPSACLDRKECVMATIEFPGKKNLFVAHIERPKGKPPELQPWSGDNLELEGRFIGILPGNSGN